LEEPRQADEEHPEPFGRYGREKQKRAQHFTGEDHVRGGLIEKGEIVSEERAEYPICTFLEWPIKHITLLRAMDVEDIHEHSCWTDQEAH
jgi:hypothetical protein